MLFRSGYEQDIIRLDRPRMGLYLSTMVWKDMYDFSGDSVLLVLASEHYDAEEYIRNYDDFVEEIGKYDSDRKNGILHSV